MARRSAKGALRRSSDPTASRSNATKDAGVDWASAFTREAAGWIRWERASKASPSGPATTISPSTTMRSGRARVTAATTSGK